MRPSRRGTIAMIFVASILGVAAVTLHATVNSLRVSFKKTPVESRLPMTSVGSTFGPWAQFTIDRALSADFEHELGAKDYVFRNYVDTRKLKPADRKRFLAASVEER